MFPEQIHAAGLRALIAGRFHETHLYLCFKIVETRVDETITVKVDFPPVAVRNPAVIVARMDFRDPAVRRRLMSLHFAALLVRLLFQLSANRIECIAYGNVSIFVRMVAIGRSVCHQFTGRRANVDRYLKYVSLVMVFVRSPDGDSATYDIGAIAFEFFDMFADIGFNGG